MKGEEEYMTKKVKTKKENKIRKCGYKRHTASDKDMNIKPFSAILPFFSSFLF